MTQDNALTWLGNFCPGFGFSLTLFSNNTFHRLNWDDTNNDVQILTKSMSS